jgi:hypothetical protein
MSDALGGTVEMVDVYRHYVASGYGANPHPEAQAE